MPRSELALVTGASSGIGRELALILAREGYALALVARRGGRLGELKSQIERELGKDHVVHVYETDLSLPDAADHIAQRVMSLESPLTVLVNNAGFGAYGPFLSGDPDLYSRMVAVNVSAVTRLTRFLLPSMVERGRGRILNIASVASFQPGPLMAVYYATKAYLLSLSEALSEELAGTGVSVTALCPGPTSSEFHKLAGIASGSHPEGTSTSRGSPSRANRTRRMPSSADVAMVGYRAMERGRRVVVYGPLYRLLVFLVRFAPRRTVASLVRRIQESRAS